MGPKRLIHHLAFAILFSVSLSPAAEPAPQTGPETEKRFPPLHVPEGFSAKLFACDPLVQYPSVIARGPRPGMLFVACDFVKGEGNPIKRRDEIRLAEDTDSDGYADRAPVFAEGFNSIQGLEFSGGTLFVMHAPLLTALEDTDGDGTADERRDLLSGLGLPPEENPSRLHCANGVTAGYDGWLYLAQGDNGIDVPRPEGDRLVHHGGAILRCRPDGRDLHVFASGLRNIYDVALDDDLNVFVRDNENDGGDYMVRVCFSFFGADHGYPYLYRDRPDEALARIADLGRGSSAGGVSYGETQFPAEYRGDLFFCEWGRAVVRYWPQRSGGGFGEVREHDFAVGDPADPYGFRPTDIVIQADGTMMISDWADGQETGQKRGRIYLVQHGSESEETKRWDRYDRFRNARNDSRVMTTFLHSASRHVRDEAQRKILRLERDDIGAELTQGTLARALTLGELGPAARRHAVWMIARLRPAAPTERLLDDLFDVFAKDPDNSVRLQAVRAIAVVSDPVLVQHKLDAGRGDAKVAGRLAALFPDQSPAVQREIIIALGRLRWKEAPTWLAENFPSVPEVELRGTTTEPPEESPPKTGGDTLVPRVPTPGTQAIEHAAMQLLRRCDNWPGVVVLLKLQDDDVLRSITLRALAEQYNTGAVDGLTERLDKATNAAHQSQYADLLTHVWRKPGEWKYWGYRPGPRPLNTEGWERTEQIAAALNRCLSKPDSTARLAVLAHMRREGVPLELAVLRDWLRSARDEHEVATLLTAADSFAVADVQADLTGVIEGLAYAAANRRAALAMLLGKLGDDRLSLLVELSSRVEDGPVMADVLDALASLAATDNDRVNELLLSKLDSVEALVRAAAIDGLALRKIEAAKPRIAALLADERLIVQVAAAHAAGTLRIESTAETLRSLTASSETALRDASFHALRQLGDAGAVDQAVQTLQDSASPAAALAYLTTVGQRDSAAAVTDVALRNPTGDILHTAVVGLSRWAEDVAVSADDRRDLAARIARIQGHQGHLSHWHAAGPLSSEEAERALSVPAAGSDPPADDANDAGRLLPISDQVLLPAGEGVAERHWIVRTQVFVEQPAAVEFQLTSRDAVDIWINGERRHQQAAREAVGVSIFEGNLSAGTSNIVVAIAAAEPAAPFSLGFRHRADSAELERLAQAALRQTGDVENGRRLFYDVAKTQCTKCHRIGERGERIGPDLTGIGGRFSRTHILESILQPSRSIANGYQTLAVETADGIVVSGIVIAQDDESLTLADSKGDKHRILRSDIQTQGYQPLSTMPAGLEKPLSEQEFVDLVSFLTGERKR